MTKQVLQQALEALKESTYSLQVPYVSCQKGVATRCLCRSCVIERNDAAIEALKALAQQGEQQPVRWVDLQPKAQAIVEGKILWKRFIDGTPLANDIACWMSDFAMEYAGAAPAAQPGV